MISAIYPGEGQYSHSWLIANDGATWDAPNVKAPKGSARPIADRMLGQPDDQAVQPTISIGLDVVFTTPDRRWDAVLDC
jgi:hypothetical protein